MQRRRGDFESLGDLAHREPLVAKAARGARHGAGGATDTVLR